MENLKEILNDLVSDALKERTENIFYAIYKNSRNSFYLSRIDDKGYLSVLEILDNLGKIYDIDFKKLIIKKEETKIE